jgi:hypothetical protein
MRESERSSSLLDEGGVFVISCVGCVAGFVCCVVVLVGEEGPRSDGMWLCGIVCLCVGWLGGWLATCVL